LHYWVIALALALAYHILGYCGIGLSHIGFLIRFTRSAFLTVGLFRSAFHLDPFGPSNMNLNALGSLSNLKSLCLENIVNSDLGNSIEAAKFQHLNEIRFSDACNLSDNDIGQIAKTYGQQV
jgi:hypothetical protein